MRNPEAMWGAQRQAQRSVRGKETRESYSDECDLMHRTIMPARGAVACMASSPADCSRPMLSGAAAQYGP